MAGIIEQIYSESILTNRCNGFMFRADLSSLTSAVVDASFPVIFQVH